MEFIIILLIATTVFLLAWLSKFDKDVKKIEEDIKKIYEIERLNVAWMEESDKTVDAIADRVGVLERGF